MGRSRRNQSLFPCYKQHTKLHSLHNEVDNRHRTQASISDIQHYTNCKKLTSACRNTTRSCHGRQQTSKVCRIWLHRSTQDSIQRCTPCMRPCRRWCTLCIVQNSNTYPGCQPSIPRDECSNNFDNLWPDHIPQRKSYKLLRSCMCCTVC